MQPGQHYMHSKISTFVEESVYDKDIVVSHFFLYRSLGGVLFMSQG